jgi:hypothetical protein
LPSALLGLDSETAVVFSPRMLCHRSEAAYGCSCLRIISVGKAGDLVGHVCLLDSPT